MPARKLGSLYGALVRLRNRPIVPPGGNQYLLWAASRATNVFLTFGRKLYDQSSLPLVTSSWLVLWLLDWAGMRTCAGAILLACQYPAFFFSVYSVGANFCRVNGPVPTGFLFVNLVGSEIELHRCWG